MSEGRKPFLNLKLTESFLSLEMYRFHAKIFHKFQALSKTLSEFTWSLRSSQSPWSCPTSSKLWSESGSFHSSPHLCLCYSIMIWIMSIILDAKASAHDSPKICFIRWFRLWISLQRLQLYECLSQYYTFLITNLLFNLAVTASATACTHKCA